MKKFNTFLKEVAVSEAQLFRILDEIGRTKIYDEAAKIAAGFQTSKDRKGDVQKIIDLIATSKEDVGYVVSNLKSFQRRI